MFCFADDEIRQSEGFKNVSLGNVIPTSFKGFRHQFLSDADRAMMDKFAVTAFEVGLHHINFVGAESPFLVIVNLAIFFF